MYAATCDVSTYSFIQNRRFASVAALPLRECMFTHVRRVKATKCASVCALENAFIHFSGLAHHAKIYTVEQSHLPSRT
jgi:hypothetical protein